MRQVVIYKGEDGFWVAETPSLPGCISQGETKEQALINIREAIQAYIESLEQDGLPVPEEKFETLSQGAGSRTLRSILRQSGLSVDEFLKFL